MTKLQESLVTVFQICLLLLLPMILLYFRGKKTTCLAMNANTTQSVAHVKAYIVWSMGIVENLLNGAIHQW